MVAQTEDVWQNTVSEMERYGFSILKVPAESEEHPVFRDICSRVSLGGDEFDFILSLHGGIPHHVSLQRLVHSDEGYAVLPGVPAPAYVSATYTRDEVGRLRKQLKSWGTRAIKSDELAHSKLDRIFPVGVSYTFQIPKAGERCNLGLGPKNYNSNLYPRHEWQEERRHHCDTSEELPILRPSYLDRRSILGLDIAFDRLGLLDSGRVAELLGGMPLGSFFSVHYRPNAYIDLIDDKLRLSTTLENGTQPAVQDLSNFLDAYSELYAGFRPYS